MDIVKSQPSSKRICQLVSVWLDSLDNDKAKLEKSEDPAQTEIKTNEALLLIHAFPKNIPRRGRTIGVQSDPIRANKVIPTIRDAIETKSRRYGDLNAPYVMSSL